MVSKKVRLDELLVSSDLASDREQAAKLIMAGNVRVNSELLDKPGTLVSGDANVEVSQELKYVSRGGYKLEAALDHFKVQVNGKVCADVGCSVGGFSDVLLQRGASKVYAIDTAYGDLAWKIRNDQRVTIMERTNATKVEKLPEQIDLAVVDVSLVSLRVIIPAVARWLKDEGEIVALLKPQYELVSKGEQLEGGVIKDITKAKQIANDLVSELKKIGFIVSELIESPLKGMHGNTEYLLKLGRTLI